MISFEHFKMEDGMPVYLQILIYIKRGIVAGTIKDNDELPSRRVLSALLGLNPNTVQKAYKILEDEGLIQSRSGAKSNMVVSEEKMKELKKELLENDVKNVILAMQQMGLSKQEALEIISEYWKWGRKNEELYICIYAIAKECLL